MRTVNLLSILLVVAFSCNQKPDIYKATDNPKYTDSVGKFSVDTLISIGLSIEPSHFKISKSTVKNFRGLKIPLTICASFSQNGFGQLDSLMILIGDEKQKIVVGQDAYEMSSPNDVLRIESEINIKDYNFDDIPDISIYSTQSGMKNIMETIFIYNKEKNSYYENEILSQSSNCKIDSINKTIATFGQGGMASMIFNIETYRWEGNNLQKIQSIRQNYNDELDLFVRETKTLKNLVWIVVLDTLTETQLLEMQKSVD